MLSLTANPSSLVPHTPQLSVPHNFPYPTASILHGFPYFMASHASQVLIPHDFTPHVQAQYRSEVRRFTSMASLSILPYDLFCKYPVSLEYADDGILREGGEGYVSGGGCTDMARSDSIQFPVGIIPGLIIELSSS
jgi:hypothetical protein